MLRPAEILSYFLKHEHYCEDWECADKKALNYLERSGFNTYPEVIPMSEEDEKSSVWLFTNDIYSIVEDAIEGNYGKSLTIDLRKESGFKWWKKQS